MTGTESKGDDIARIWSEGAVSLDYRDGVGRLTSAVAGSSRPRRPSPGPDLQIRKARGRVCHRLGIPNCHHRFHRLQSGPSRNGMMPYSRKACSLSLLMETHEITVRDDLKGEKEGEGRH